MQQAAPLVSVIVPIYNVERFLDQALESVEAQTLHNLEILCVNDGSTDSSPDIVRDHASRDERIRLIDKPNGGYGSACNRGIDEARGTWIAILEPDDWIDPAMYEDMTTYADTFRQDIDIVKTPYWRVVNPDTPAQHLLNCSYKGRIRPARQPFTLADKGTDHLLIHHPSIWSALYRADFLRDRDIRFQEIPGAGWADNPFLVETLCQARSIVYLDWAYYYYREETEEKTASFARNYLTVPFERWHDMMDVLDRIGVRNEAVLRAQFRRGFTYLDYISAEIDAHDPRVHSIMPRMFARMDDDIVMSEPNISPAWKRRYLETKGLAKRAINPFSYAGSLVSAGLYSVKNVGIAEMLKVAGAVVSHNKTASNLVVQPDANSIAVGDSAEVETATGFDAETGSRTEAETGTEAKSKADTETRAEKGASTPRASQPDEPSPASSAPLPDTLTDDSPTDQVKLSIVIPVYNAAPHLEACLNSLANQTYGAFEAICVDDGSTDDSREILERQAAQDGRFRVLHQENQGPSAARNTGIEAATGDYVCFLDADDLYECTTCQRIAEEAASRDCDCIVFAWTCFPPDQANEWLLDHTHVRDAFYPRFVPAVLFQEMTNPFLRVAVKRDLLNRESIRFDEQLRVGEDSAFLFALFPRAGATTLISDELYRYRMPHEGSITDTSRDGDSEKCIDDLCAMISIFGDWNRAGILKRYAPELVHWFVWFFLYTFLRQPAEVRDPLILATKELLCGYFTEDELRRLPVPAHDPLLIDVVLSASEEGLGMSERELSRAMLDWRMIEYGPLHLAKTALGRLG